jgi:hypothetical protein
MTDGATGYPRPMPQRTVPEILAAIATTERVSAFLASYDERDTTIELLTNDVLLNRLRLVSELSEQLLSADRTLVQA